MGFVTIEDLSGAVEVTVFSDIYSEAVSILKSDDPLIIIGKLEATEKGAKVLVHGAKEAGSEWQKKNRGPAGSIKLLTDARSQSAKKVLFTLQTDTTPTEHLEQLRKIITRHSGSTPTFLLFKLPHRGKATVQLPQDLYVAPNDELILEVEQLFGYNAATFE